MAQQFHPDILFTQPTMANQFVRLSELAAAKKNEQQQMAMAMASAAQERQARERSQQNQNAVQYAALMNQQRGQDFAANQFEREIGSRESMFKQQVELQKELGRLNPYGKYGGDIALGNMQLGNQIDQSNVDADTEAKNLTAALNARHEKFLQDYNASVRDTPSWYKPKTSHWYNPASLLGTDSADVARSTEALRNQYLIDKSALIGSAKHSTYDEKLRAFVPAKRNSSQIPRMGNLGTVQPALDIPSTAPNYQSYGPGLNSPGDQIDEQRTILNNSYLNGQITPDEFARQWDALGR